jgi:glycosyltransferase involved in cell wall biosynthesis
MQRQCLRAGGRPGRPRTIRFRSGKSGSWSLTIAKIAYLFAESKGSLYGSTGRSVHIRELCAALAEAGQDVFIVAALKGSEPGTPDGVPIHEVAPEVASFMNRRAESRAPVELRYLGAEKRGSLGTSRSPRQIAQDVARVVWWKCWDTYFHRRARQEVIRERPDFLYERYVRGTSSGIRIAREFNLPFIVEMNTSFTFPGEWWNHHSAITPWVIARNEQRLTEAADKVIVVSTHLRDHLVATGVRPDKVELMFNGADSQRFRPEDERAKTVRSKYGLHENLVVGFVGSLKPWHGVDVLIRSFRQCVRDLPNLRLLIVGEGPLRESLELLARDSGLTESIVFTGAIPHDEVPSYVVSLDIAVCPAPRTPNYHLSPIKLFEYMASARPVIAGRFSDIPLVIRDHENGILVTPGDEAELTRAMLELAGDPALRLRLGDAARNDVERSYTWQRNAERVLELYREAIQAKESRLAQVADARL